MNKDYNILDYLKNNNSVYAVPKKYFETLSNKVIIKIKNNTNSFLVPNNYFNSISNTILQKVKTIEAENELNQIAPFLNSISKQNIYSLPNNYFENVTIKKPTKVVIFSKHKIFKYAVAASLVGLLSIFVLKNNKSNSTIANNYKISLQTNVIKEIDNLPDSILKLAETFEKESIFTINDNVENTGFLIDNFQDELQNVDQEDLQYYLENNKHTEDINI